MQNTQVVSNNFGWVGVVGLVLAALTLIAMWAVNDKYSFVVLQLQMMTERQNRTEQRLELLEVREQARVRREQERNEQ